MNSSLVPECGLFSFIRDPDLSTLHTLHHIPALDGFKELATVVVILFNSAWLWCCEASLGCGQCCCYHPSQVNIIQNVTFQVCFFLGQPKYTHVYCVPIRFHAMSIMSSVDLFFQIVISLRKTRDFNITNQVSKSLTFPHLQRIERRPRQCAT